MRLTQLQIFSFGLAVSISNQLIIVAADVDDRTVNDVVDEYWQRILDVPEPALIDPGDESQLISYWRELHDQCSPLMVRMISETRDTPHEAARAFLQKLYDAETSRQQMRWLSAGEIVFIPDGRPTYRSGPGFEHVEAWMCAAAEVQVRDMLEDSKRLALFYRILAWRGLYLRNWVLGGSGGQVREGIADGPESARYWWHIRDFVFQTVAFGREDMFRHVEPEELGDQVVPFGDWVDANLHRFVPSSAGPIWCIDNSVLPFGDRSIPDDLTVIPDTPFENYDGPPTSRSASFTVYFNIDLDD